METFILFVVVGGPILAIAVLRLLALVAWKIRMVHVLHRHSWTSGDIAHRLDMSWDLVVSILIRKRQRLERRGRPIDESLSWPSRGGVVTWLPPKSEDQK